LTAPIVQQFNQQFIGQKSANIKFIIFAYQRLVSPHTPVPTPLARSVRSWRRRPSEGGPPVTCHSSLVTHPLTAT
jgi:hypothetical protein